MKPVPSQPVTVWLGNHAFGRIMANCGRKGKPIAALDAQIAAIAFAHGAIFGDSQTSEFQHCGVKLISPWTYSN